MHHTLLLLLSALALVGCNSSRSLMLPLTEVSPPPGIPKEIWGGCYRGAVAAANGPAHHFRMTPLTPDQRFCLYMRLADECARPVVEDGDKSMDPRISSEFSLEDYVERVSSELETCATYDYVLKPLFTRILPTARQQWEKELEACGCVRR